MELQDQIMDGDLQTLGLQSILEMLALSGKTGTLFVHSGPETISISLRKGQIMALREGEAADETRALAADKAVGAYKKSKVMAERLVDDMVERAGLPAVIVNPSTPIGPRDVKPTPTGRIIVEAACGRMPARTSGPGRSQASAIA